MPRKKNKKEKETEGPFLKMLFARISQQNNFRYKKISHRVKKTSVSKEKYDEVENKRNRCIGRGRGEK